MASAGDRSTISSESKQSLQNQVADIQFEDKPFKIDACKCQSCKHVAIDYCMSNCNHVFCTKCYLENFNNLCPTCNTTITERTQDSEFERMMLQLKVSCKFKKNGCEEVVQLGEYLDHLKKCKWETRRLLPKVYKETINTAAEDIKQINFDLKNMKEEMQLMQAEKDKLKRSHDEVQEMKQLQRKDKETMQLMKAENKRLELSTKKNQEELQNLKQMLKKDQDAIELLQSENNKLESAHKLLKSTSALELKKNDEEMQNIKQMLQKDEDAIVLLQAENNKLASANERETKKNQAELQEIKQLQQSDKETMQAENKGLELSTKKNQEQIQKLKQMLKKDEESKELLQSENNKLVSANKLETKRNQEEIQNLKQLLQKDEATQLLQSENKRLERALAFAMQKNQEELQEMKLMLRKPKNRSGGQVHEFQWRISGFQKKLQDLMDKKCVAIESEEEFSISHEFKVKPRLEKQNDGEEIVHIYLEFTSNNGSLMYLNSRKYILLDQSDSTDKKDIELIDRPKFRMNSAKEMISSSFTYSFFFSGSLFKGPNRYLKQDEIVIKVILEPISLFYKEVVSHDGTLLWRIDNYSKKKKEEIDGLRECLISQPCKTKETGYTVQVILCLNGYEEAKGSHISMYIRFVLGEWDEFLPCPFQCKYSFHILDQSESQVKENQTKEACHEFKANGLTWGFAELEVQSVVESPKYLKNDSLLLKTVVEIL